MIPKIGVMGGSNWGGAEWCIIDGEGGRERDRTGAGELGKMVGLRR